MHVTHRTAVRPPSPDRPGVRLAPRPAREGRAHEDDPPSGRRRRGRRPGPLAGRRVLWIAGEAAAASELRRCLEREGVVLERVAGATAALELTAREPWDLVLLDRDALPRDGLDLCRRLRGRDPRLPLIMTSDRGAEADRVAGLRAGADDYVVAPIALAELLARMRALLRRSGPSPAPATPIAVGDITIDPLRREARVAGREVALTSIEFALLSCLAARPGRVLGKEELLQAVWGRFHPGYRGMVATHVSRLRAKVEPDPGRPRYLETVWGVGYRLTGR